MAVQAPWRMSREQAAQDAFAAKRDQPTAPEPDDPALRAALRVARRNGRELLASWFSPPGAREVHEAIVGGGDPDDIAFARDKYGE